MNESFLLRLNRWQRAAFFIGLLFCALCLVGGFFNARQFFVSYLFAYLFWIGLSLGCLCVAMIHHLTGGRWGDVIRRFLEAGYMTLPVMAVLFVPVLFGLLFLYPWANPMEVAQNAILLHKARYLNVPGFIGRAIFYFLVWNLIAFLLRKWSCQQDQTIAPENTIRARTLSGPGVAVYALTVTFAWIDWLMSTEADWYSTMFPVIVCGGQILAAFAFTIVLLAAFRNQPDLLPVVESTHFHQLGNFLLTFVMFWTYVCFGQLLIIWSGNLPRETGWYLHRIAGGWKWIAGFLVLFNFFLPFLILLSRRAKKNIHALRSLALVVLTCQMINSYWLAEPTFYPHGVHFHWLDCAAPLGLGGLWVASFIAALKRAPLLPKNHPRISYTLAHAK